VGVFPRGLPRIEAGGGRKRAIGRNGGFTGLREVKEKGRVKGPATGWLSRPSSAPFRRNSPGPVHAWQGGGNKRWGGFFAQRTKGPCVGTFFS